jgi:signal transduction histidine kinase
MSVLNRLHARPRLTRQTVRLRLTLLYGSLFLASGAGLLAITYLLVRYSTGNYLLVRSGTDTSIVFARHTHGQPAPNSVLHTPGGAGWAPTSITLAQARAQIHQLLTQAAQQHSAELHQLLVQSVTALAIMAAVAIGLGWLVAGRVLQPLRTITTAVQTISAGNLHARLALDGPDDEITELGKTFNALLARLEGSFEAQRRFVANASHELRTPLTRQRTLVEVACGDPEATVGSLRATYARVLAAVEQQERLIEALLTLARGERGIERREPFDLAALTGEVLLTWSMGVQRRRLRVEATLRPAPAMGDARLAERLVANLVDNAVRYNTDEGRIAVRTGIGDGHVILSVANSGPLIPPAAIDLLFQPFQRLGAARTGHRDGLGLGLSIVQAIATAHGAAVTARAQPEGGLAIDVRFPVADSGATV